MVLNPSFDPWYLINEYQQNAIEIARRMKIEVGLHASVSFAPSRAMSLPKAPSQVVIHGRLVTRASIGSLAIDRACGLELCTGMLSTPTLALEEQAEYLMDVTTAVNEDGFQAQSVRWRSGRSKQAISR